MAATIDLAQTIRVIIYIDNVITVAQSVQKAIEFYNISRQLFKGAAMNLRDWMSNSEEIMDEIPICNRANRGRMKILGLTWTVKEDILKLTSQITKHLGLTKRTVLQPIASVYDPLGLFSPVTLRGKLFLQTLWDQKICWEDYLSEQDKLQWHILSEDLKKLASSKFPRYIGLDQDGRMKYQLLVFCNASKSAYATAVYLLQESTMLRKIDLIFSQTRLAPNKTLTIPRLELSATLIGSRCLKFVQKELMLDISEKHIWIDSECVLNWLNSKRDLSTFVENRIKEIKEDRGVKFHYISTAENPADIASRGASAREIHNNRLWWHGPDWVTRTRQAWPVWKCEDIVKQSEAVKSDIESEFRKTKVLFETKLVAGEGPSQVRKGILQEAPFNLDITNFSSVTKLWRVTALVVRFIDKLRKNTGPVGPLGPTEITKAEELWKKYVQRQQYHEVVESIYKSKFNNLVSAWNICRLARIAQVHWQIAEC